MHWGNAAFGHSTILARYVGLPRHHHPIWGYLQHGWNPEAGGFQRTTTKDFVPKYVWNATNAVRARELGMPRVVPMGAPFLYLHHMLSLPLSEEDPDAMDRVIVYPFHASEWEGTVGSHEAMAREVREREVGHVTVCLYWVEFEKDEIRASYERQGFRVICHGYRYDPWFLFRQYLELRAHGRVVSNRVSTALWYGALLGRSVQVYGERFGLLTGEEGDAFAELQRQRWPALIQKGLSGGQRSIHAGQEELGAKFLRPPEELAALLGWRGPVRASAPLLRLGVAGVRYARRLRHGVPVRVENRVRERGLFGSVDKR